jgi:sugar transferase (PEP-CTERM/EpsH1 system associated)
MAGRGRQRPDGIAPLIAHVVFRFDIGGLENGVVNVVNGLAGPEFRHAIIALAGDAELKARIHRADVAVYCLGKRPGKDPGAYYRLYRLLRRLRPTIVHTRNIGTIDCVAIAALAGVPVRLHGEHGWDVHDPDGTRRRYLLMRLAMRPFIDRFVTVSRELEQWLLERVGIPARQLERICNGVDTGRFQPRRAEDARSLPEEYFPAGCVVIGSVTRFQEIKDPCNLVRAFIDLRRRLAGRGPDVRLLMAGDGPLKRQAQALLEASGEAQAAWLPGSRDDVPALLRQLDVFVLGSRREGISNTVLEAMASGLPVIATAVGGNRELVIEGATGSLVPPENSDALAAAMARYACDADMRRERGRCARERALAEYSLHRMISDYRELYRSFSRPLGDSA